MRSTAWWQGYLAACKNLPRHCDNPWSAAFVSEWLNGYDACETEYAQQEEDAERMRNQREYDGDYD